MADLMILRPDHYDFFGRLNKIGRKDWVEHKARNTNRPASFFRRVGGLPGTRPFIHLPQFLPCPGLQDKGWQGLPLGRRLAPALTDTTDRPRPGHALSLA